LYYSPKKPLFPHAKVIPTLKKPKIIQNAAAAAARKAKIKLAKASLHSQCHSLKHHPPPFEK